MRALLSSLFWLFIVVTSLLCFPIAVLLWAITAPFDRRLRALHLFTCFWASLYTWFNPAWRVTVEGRARIRRDRTYVMVANHQSLLDILVLFRLFVHFKWVSKEEIFRVPCVGWNMSMNRYIKLRRGDRESVAAMMARCGETLAEGSSVMIFPEGTRSVDGRLKAFKPGAFILAKRHSVPLLPILIQGTSAALPKRGFILRGRHRIRVKILDEIPVESFEDATVEELLERTHERFARALDGTVTEAA
jgi:1-acyl-sn-glycerol-3-phosphate acyltransferase